MAHREPACSALRSRASVGASSGRATPAGGRNRHHSGCRIPAKAVSYLAFLRSALKLCNALSQVRILLKQRSGCVSPITEQSRVIWYAEGLAVEKESHRQEKE